MTILHVTDFHFNKRSFDWLLHRAPAHDLTVVSGDPDLDASVIRSRRHPATQGPPRHSASS